MKKILMAILVAVLSISCVFAITACDNEETVKVTITYDADGGVVSQQTQEVDASNFELLVPTKAGYTFTGWTLNGEPFTNENSISSNVTLKATWQINKFNVTFDVGTRGTIEGDSVKTLDAVGYVLPNVTTKPGAEFVGWTLNGADFASTTVLTENITLVAKYNVTAYQVTYVYYGKLKRGGSSLVLNENTEMLAVSDYVLPTVEREGYTFNGWKVQGSDTLFDATAPLTDDLILVADQTQNKYKIVYFNSLEAYEGYIANGTYEDTDCTVVDNVVYNSNITTITANKDYYTHVGWKGFYKEGSTSYTINAFENGLFQYEGDVYVYPIFVADEFTITYASGVTADFTSGDTYVATHNVADKATVTLAAAPTHEDGKPFKHWLYTADTVDVADDVVITTDDQLQTLLTSLAVKDANVNLIAIFNENEYIVYRYGTTTLQSIVAEEGVTYDVTNVENMPTLEAGYHFEWFIGTNAFAPFSFATEDDLVTVIIDLKQVANVATVNFVVWGNDLTVGTVSAATASMKTGDAISVTTTGLNGYNFYYWTTEAWTTTTSDAPAKVASTIVTSDGKLIVAENNATITLYAYFYNPIV